MSLREDAIKDELPSQQFMDVQTLQWVRSTTGALGYKKSSISLSPEAIEYLSIFEPSDAWFVNKSRVPALHGKRHLIRVTVYTYLIITLLMPEYIPILDTYLIASSLHDIRRYTDKADVGHGERAARWFEENAEEIFRFYNKQFNQKNVRDISYVISNHETPNIQSKDIDVEIIRTADALDRFIQPKEKWWIDDNFLKIVPTKDLKTFAVNLVIQSEEQFLKNGINNLSVYPILSL